MSYLDLRQITSTLWGKRSRRGQGSPLPEEHGRARVARRIPFPRPEILTHRSGT